MPDEAAIRELAALLVELRTIVRSLRSSADALAAAEGPRKESDARQHTRSVVREFERARRRGQEGRLS